MASVIGQQARQRRAVVQPFQRVDAFDDSFHAGRRQRKAREIVALSTSQN